MRAPHMQYAMSACPCAVCKRRRQGHLVAVWHPCCSHATGQSAPGTTAFGLARTSAVTMVTLVVAIIAAFVPYKRNYTPPLSLSAICRRQGHLVRLWHPLCGHATQSNGAQHHGPRLGLHIHHTHSLQPFLLPPSFLPHNQCITFP